MSVKCEGNLPWISPKWIMVKRRKDKCGIHYFCHSYHVTYLHFIEDF